MHTKVLCILDGFGLAPESPSNAFSQDICPHIHSLFKNHPWLMLDADGDAVGQETGLVGNSEVGHMNLGGLQLVKQLSYEITQSAKQIYNKSTSNQLFDPKTVLNNQKSDTIHLIGLFSEGTIHSDLRHWLGAILASHKSNINNIVLHLISDGRDTDRQSLVNTWNSFITKNQKQLKEVEKSIYLGSIGGRFFGMDRDNNDERIKTALKALYEEEEGITEFRDIYAALSSISAASYANNVFDEHINPQNTGISIKNDDYIWLINFRSDRMKQISKALIQEGQKNHFSNIILANNNFGTGLERILTNTENIATTHVLEGYFPIFMRKDVKNTFSDYCYKNNKTVLHIAETEKYAHVTYFFTGGRKEARKNENFKLIPSNKVQSHADMPAMKAEAITEYIIQHGLGEYDYIIVNYANPDMVGHTGDIQAATESMRFLDIQLKKLTTSALDNGHKIIITADHGNVESVGQVSPKKFDTEHNASPVPCIIVGKDFDKNTVVDSFAKITEQENIDISLYKTIEEQVSIAMDNQDSFENWFKSYETNYPLWVAGLLLLSL